MNQQRFLLAAVAICACISSLSAETISIPDTPTGPASGYIKVVYTFSTTGGSVSSEGHPVEYRFNWGNGKYSDWETSLTASTLGGAMPTYTDGGTFNITVQARCQTHPEITAESEPLLFLVQECQFYNLTKKITTFVPTGTDNVVNASDVSKIITYINMYRVSTAIWAVPSTSPWYEPGFNLDPSSPAINSADVSVLVNYIYKMRISTAVWVAGCTGQP